MKIIETDCVIVGGGIAGLFTANLLFSKGYQVLLIENSELGGMQTILSQGIIHGGLKYAIQGIMNNSATSLSEIPKIWQQCLNGATQALLNLSDTKILSNYQYIFSTDSLVSKVSSFFSSIALNSRVTKNVQQVPAIFQNDNFVGQLYALHEMVLDVPSLLQNLSSKLTGNMLKVAAVDGCIVEYDSGNSRVSSLKLNLDDPDGTEVKVKASKYIFTAGAGNAELLKDINKSPAMQLRPLHMVMVKHPKLCALYAHCITGTSSVPKLTISSHFDVQDNVVWYLGGELAEVGVGVTEKQQAINAQQLLAKTFPWLNLADAQFASVHINRAEHKTKNKAKPDTETIFELGNAILAWPTKLAFAPVVAEKILKICKQSIQQQGYAVDPAITKIINNNQPSCANGVWKQANFVGVADYAI